MSSTSTVEFSNLPTDAIGKIIEKCDLKEQLTLRKVSKDLRSLVDEHKLAYKSIAIISNDSYITCVYNNNKVTYARKNWDEMFEANEQEELGLAYEESCILRSNDHVKTAMNDISIALNNPKLRLDELTVSFQSNNRMRRFRLNSLLKQLNHQIHVKALTLRAGSPKYLLSVLRCLKPKVLVDIEIIEGYSDDWAPERASKSLNEIASLEQWKQAEELTAQDCFDYFPSECRLHFKRFTILFREVTEQFLIEIRDLFSTSTNFESCTVVSYGLRDYPDYLESFCEKVESGEEVIYHYKIPDESNKMLEFKKLSKYVDHLHPQIDIYGIDMFWMQNFGTYNIIQMDQYNKAKLVRIMFSTGFFLFDRISDAVLCGFKFYCLTMDTLFSLRNIFSRSPTFKHCNIECVYLPLIEELAVELGLRLEPGNYLPVFYQYLIPDSTDVLIYEFWMDHIEIRRVSYMEML
ncbi:hypothetical protein GCK72_021033 [Caenorhabditis remanei]|uniref:F-box domain-containing protein n=1 Tax=Caenorhabditis remanei TaxID=31234 RepID=A0A6A5GH17_CAERE|nr:hypothetical protein GCK72_021033 [Caenorhabditis remanei]KAF1754470.1 hypothetical protein GCK72_021033 [Caenorhabditis remanei]